MSINRSPKHLEVTIRYAKKLRQNQTKTETILWEELRGRRCGGWKFVRQRPILIELDGVGTFAVADFYCAAAKLIVEIDGSVHELQRERDEARDGALGKRGYSVMRIAAMDVERHLDQVLARIDKEVRCRARY